MRIPRVGFGIAHAANRVFVVGGLVPAYYAHESTQHGWTPIGAVEVLDLLSDSPNSWLWQAGKSLLNPAHSLLVPYHTVGDDDLIIAIGGSSFSQRSHGAQLNC